MSIPSLCIRELHINPKSPRLFKMTVTLKAAKLSFSITHAPPL